MFKHKAILVIHGFAGGVYDEEYLINYLEFVRNFDVFSFTLPGHDVRDKKDATEEKWIKKSEKQLKMLLNHGYKEIYIVGHSMGGVIATYLTNRYHQVKKLVLVAPAFTSLGTKEQGGLLSAFFKIPDLVKSYSYQELLTRVSKLPIASEKEFMNLINHHKRDIYDIDVPIMFVHGSEDQVVPVESSIKLYDKINNKKKKLVIVDGYYHDVFKGRKVESICKEIRKFLVVENFMIKSEKISL